MKGKGFPTSAQSSINGFSLEPGNKLMLSKTEIRKKLQDWMHAWNRHDLEEVMDLFHHQVVFESWHGERIRGKRLLRAAWKDWFEHHGGFHFEPLEVIIDQEDQKALIRWNLEWPCPEEPLRGKTEIREGLDLLHFRDGLIDLKLTYTKAAVKIEGRKYRFQLKE
jgi:uncharacterized protein (TIGR02246 family)